MQSRNERGGRAGRGEHAVPIGRLETGKPALGHGRGFSAQVDLSALFIERSITLAREGRTIALLVPVKLWRSLAGGGIRSRLLQQTEIVELHDLTESRQLFDAAVYPSVLIARRKSSPLTALPASSTRMVVHRRESAIHWPLSPDCRGRLGDDGLRVEAFLVGAR